MTYFVIFFAVATFAVLVLGLVIMVRGGEVNKKYSNKLMAARVWMQAITLALIALFLVAKH